MNKDDTRKIKETIEQTLAEFNSPSVNYVVYTWQGEDIPGEILEKLAQDITKRGYPVIKQNAKGMIIGRPQS